VCGYSDQSSFIATHRSTDLKSVADGYSAALEANGYAKQYDFTMSGTLSRTYTKGTENVALAVMDYEGQAMVSMSRY
jgi:hypothetical protein